MGPRPTQEVIVQAWRYFSASMSLGCVTSASRGGGNFVVILGSVQPAGPKSNLRHCRCRGRQQRARTPSCKLARRASNGRTSLGQLLDRGELGRSPPPSPSARLRPQTSLFSSNKPRVFSQRPRASRGVAEEAKGRARAHLMRPQPAGRPTGWLSGPGQRVSNFIMKFAGQRASHSAGHFRACARARVIIWCHREEVGAGRRTGVEESEKERTRCAR